MKQKIGIILLNNPLTLFIGIYFPNWLQYHFYLSLDMSLSLKAVFLSYKVISVISPVMDAAAKKSHILPQHDSSADTVWSGLLLAGLGEGLLMDVQCVCLTCENCIICETHHTPTTNLRGIDPTYKSHNASDNNPTMHHLVTDMCAFLLPNGALRDLC